MKIRVTVMVCDNPDCDDSYRHTKEEPAYGFHLGKGFWSQGGGGPIPATYACSEECIGPAVMHMIREASR